MIRTQDGKQLMIFHNISRIFIRGNYQDKKIRILVALVDHNKNIEVATFDEESRAIEVLKEIEKNYFHGSVYNIPEF